MICEKCEARRKKLRAAILHGKMAEAIGQTVAGFREMVGLSVQGEPIIDASALPSLSGKTKAELIAIAADEGAEVEDGATNAEIVAAIEARRELVAA